MGHVAVVAVLVPAGDEKYLLLVARAIAAISERLRARKKTDGH